MKSLRLRTDGTGSSKLESLALPFMFFGATATDDDRAHTFAPDLAKQVSAVSTSRHADGSESSGGPRRIVIVAGGSLEVAAGGMRATLGRGDVLMVDDQDATGHTLTHRHDSRLVHIHLADGWTPQGVVPPVLDRPTGDTPQTQRMYVGDDQAWFRPFDDMFPATPGEQPRRTIAALSFLGLSADSFGDWHVETPKNLVVVLAGGFELEVGGGAGEVKIFGPGDICLVEDHHGQGHRSRAHGETRFAAIVMTKESVWS